MATVVLATVVMPNPETKEPALELCMDRLTRGVGLEFDNSLRLDCSSGFNEHCRGQAFLYGTNDTADVTSLKRNPSKTKCVIEGRRCDSIHTVIRQRIVNELS